ncbi:hypothetical protein CLF_110500 [Clonorchis sinensis]|uniref:Uncharacterized protein n=1 Tax=Clonorchis sinensis TaxID=79923 RepID=G7YTK1_CLOSI|nr:hypothetical protein CLF_110500 [Clonorchis sinensis]
MESPECLEPTVSRPQATYQQCDQHFRITTSVLCFCSTLSAFQKSTIRDHKHSIENREINIFVNISLSFRQAQRHENSFCEGKCENHIQGVELAFENKLDVPQPLPTVLEHITQAKLRMNLLVSSLTIWFFTPMRCHRSVIAVSKNAHKGILMAATRNLETFHQLKLCIKVTGFVLILVNELANRRISFSSERFTLSRLRRLILQCGSKLISLSRMSTFKTVNISRRHSPSGSFRQSLQFVLHSESLIWPFGIPVVDTIFETSNFRRANCVRTSTNNNANRLFNCASIGSNVDASYYQGEFLKPSPKGSSKYSLFRMESAEVYGRVGFVGVGTEEYSDSEGQTNVKIASGNHPEDSPRRCGPQERQNRGSFQCCKYGYNRYNSSSHLLLLSPQRNTRSFLPENFKKSHFECNQMAVIIGTVKKNRIFEDSRTVVRCSRSFQNRHRTESPFRCRTERMVFLAALQDRYEEYVTSIPTRLELFSYLLKRKIHTSLQNPAELHNIIKHRKIELKKCFVGRLDLQEFCPQPSTRRFNASSIPTDHLKRMVFTRCVHSEAIPYHLINGFQKRGKA